MPKIFISYRREDAAYPASTIHSTLSTHFGSESVVFDVDDVPVGVDFREYLIEQIASCDLMVAVIGDRWLEHLSSRLDRPEDLARVEIETALSTDMPVAPVLVNNASMPIAEDLPNTLRELAFRNASQVRPGHDLETDLTRLTAQLEKTLAGKDGCGETFPTPHGAVVVKEDVALFKPLFV